MEFAVHAAVPVHFTKNCSLVAHSGHSKSFLILMFWSQDRNLPQKSEIEDYAVASQVFDATFPKLSDITEYSWNILILIADGDIEYFKL